MYSEAKSTPVPPSGQRATAVTFDPHRPVCPRSPPRPLQRWYWVPNFCHQTQTHTHTHCDVDATFQAFWTAFSWNAAFFLLTFFLQEGFSGGQRTLTHFWVLEKFHSGVHLEREECNFSLVKLLRRQREKGKKKPKFIPNRNQLESSHHKWSPFDRFFRAPTPSCEEVRPPDHFPAKCGEWPNQQL